MLPYVAPTTTESVLWDYKNYTLQKAFNVTLRVLKQLVFLMTRKTKLTIVSFVVISTKTLWPITASWWNNGFTEDEF